MTRKKGDTISKESCKFKHKINIHPNEENDITTITNQARDIKKTVKLEGLKQIKQNWESKPLHKKYPLRRQNADWDKGNTHRWLHSAGLKPETVCFITTAPDKSLFTGNYQFKVIKNGADPKCWFCYKFEQTVTHLVSGCPIMTPNEHLQKHDRVGQYIYWKIWQHNDVPYGDNWYKHKTQKVAETESVKIL